MIGELDCSFSICMYLKVRIEGCSDGAIWAEWIREDWGW